MAERILVAYATRYGSTAGVAEAIGDELRKTGADVDVLQVDEVSDLSPYRAAVIGSPIYMGKWLPDAQIFVEQHQQRLRAIPAAFFSVGLTVTDRSPEILRKAEASMDAVRMLVNPVEIGTFSGRLESSGLSLTDRAIVTMIRAKTGDFRDFRVIRAWTQAIYQKIVEV